jgi:ribose/xylose/arabinose/galactoside ABC-type transport system permease subunit
MMYIQWAQKQKMAVGVFTILAVLILIASFLSEVFLTFRNINNVLGQAVALGIVCIGQTLVILTGGIDLSVGSVISLTSCLTTGLMLGRDSLVLPVLALVLGCALLVGFCNGLLITKIGIPPLIVTLGMMEAIQGVTLLYTDAPYGEIGPSFSFLAWGKVASIPFPILFFAGLFVASIVALHQTPFGRYIYAIGGNEQTARLSGIGTDRVKIYTYMVCSLTAAVTGFFLTSRMGMGDPIVGEPFTIDSLVPVLIGGTSLTGGKGGLIGTLGGVFVLTVLNNMLNLLDVSGYWQWIVQGLIIITVVSFYLKEKF